MKAYAPSDRGASAAVVVSQELLTAAVTGLQPTKALTIFFYFAKYLCCQQAYNQGEKKLRQCSFFSKVFIFVLPAMVQPRRAKRLRQFSFYLQNICVASKGTTKERKSCDNVLFICTIFFFSRVFIIVLPAWEREKVFFVSFLYLLHSLLYVHLARNQIFCCKWKEKAKQSIRFSLIHVVNTKQNCILSQPFTLREDIN